MKWLVPLFALIFLASPVLGCLGDTETELTARYGKQVKTGTSSIPGVTIQGYLYKGFSIVVGVLNGRSAYEMYTRKDGSKLSGAEVGALMNASSNGKAWTEDTPGPSGAAKWVLADGSAFAEWEKTPGSQLTVMTSEGAALETRATPKKEVGKPKRP